MSATTMKVDGRLAPVGLRDEAVVESWFESLLEAGLNFHPEESFGGMVDLASGVPTFDREDARRLDRLMDAAYEVCDPCEVAVRVFERWEDRRDR